VSGEGVTGGPKKKGHTEWKDKVGKVATEKELPKTQKKNQRVIIEA